MSTLVETWVNLNSFSYNQEGIREMQKHASRAFSSLEPDENRTIPFQNGDGLFLKKRPSAPVQIFFGGHLDTVFPPDHPFQKASFLNQNILQGPGASDMKGGLVILLYALKAFENSPKAKQIGWEIFLNPDEEIGSPYSTPFIEECAKRCDFAFLFEPTLPDGSFVSERKGSMNFMAYAKGKAAHAGREKGVNAINKLAHFITEIEKLDVNVGWIKGGRAANIVPDAAECIINLRAFNLEEQERKFLDAAQKHQIKIEQLSYRPPKPFDQKTASLFQVLKKCGDRLGIPVSWKATGGVCDGNTLGHAGVPTIDTLGASGGGAHTDQEFIDLESLPKKAKLVSFMLEEIASSTTPP